MTELTREQRLQNMATYTLCAPQNATDAVPGTEGHRDPWEPWSAPVMVLAGMVSRNGELVPWLYLGCRCGWWLGYAAQHDPAELAGAAARYAADCGLAPDAGRPADTGKQRLTRTLDVISDPAGVTRLREAMETPGYPDSLGARADALEDADQAAGFLTDLACMDEGDGVTETGRASLRGYVLARFPDAEG